MKILAFDTSAKVTSVAITEDTKIIAEVNLNATITHSQSLMPLMDNILAASNLVLKDIDLFAISNGPGSFTGLRIGIGAVKGLAFALDKPIAAVSTLAALAQNMSGFNGIICAAMDARCNQVYTALFDSNGTDIARLTEDMAVSIDELYEIIKKYEKNIIFVGDGAELCYNKLSANLSLCSLANENMRFQKAASVAFLGYRKAILNDVKDAESLMPSYLRLSQAERERAKKLNLQEVK